MSSNRLNECIPGICTRPNPEPEGSEGSPREMPELKLRPTIRSAGLALEPTGSSRVESFYKMRGR